MDPVHIYIIKHPSFKEGISYQEEIFKVLNRNPDKLDLKEIGIPVYFRENFENITIEKVKKTIIILMVNQSMTRDEEFIKKLGVYIKENKDNISLLPITFTKVFAKTKLDSFNFIRMDKEVLDGKLLELKLVKNIEDITEDIKKGYFLNRVLDYVAREVSIIESKITNHKIFISHTKRDKYGLSESKRLKNFISNATTSDTFFDENSIYSGEDFAEKIEKTMKNSMTIFVVVLTDSYAQSKWCRKEILWAKEHNRPIILINVLKLQELRSFPYSGNTKVIRLEGSSLELSFLKILTLSYLESIRREHNRLSLDPIMFEGDKISDSPELLTVLDFKEENILYPNPPLPLEELDILEKTKKKFITPMELTKNPSNYNNKNIMFSISESNKLNNLPLKTLISEIIKYSMYFNANILYGGFLKYKNEEYNLLKQMLQALDFYKKEERASQEANIKNYLAYPLTELINEEDYENYGNNINIKNINPENLTLTTGVGEVKLKTWSTSLTEMRNQIIDEADCVIIAGGKDSNYKGKYPGVLEEFLIAIEKNKPIFLLGGFGGVINEISNLLKGDEPKALTEKYQFEKNSEEYKELYTTLSKDYNNITTQIKSLTFENLNNNLSKEENDILFKSENIDEIIQLILKGVNNIENNS